MIETSANYSTNINSYMREISTLVYFNGSEVPVDKDLISVTVSELGQSNDYITIGDLCTNKAVVKFKNTDIPLENGYFRIEHGIKINGI